MRARAALSAGVFAIPSATDDFAELRELVDDISRRSFQSRSARGLPDPFDATAWRHLEQAGLTRLTCTPESGGGPIELALVLHTLAYHGVTVPFAETDPLAGWLAARAGLNVPKDGPLTLAFGRASGVAVQVPYANSATRIIIALPEGTALRVASLTPTDLSIVAGHNLGGEPRDTVQIDHLDTSFIWLAGVAEELSRRGAWARCMQTVGALDAAVASAVSSTRERIQFGRPLSSFQAVQHALAGMAGEVERTRAAATLAVAAAADYGFDSPQTDYAVTVAKVVLGRAVPAVVTAAHQMHGAIGVTVEHPLRLATMRARSWIDEFGDTNYYAQRLGRLALAADDPWDFVIGQPLSEN